MSVVSLSLQNRGMGGWWWSSSREMVGGEGREREGVGGSAAVGGGLLPVRRLPLPQPTPSLLNPPSRRPALFASTPPKHVEYPPIYTSIARSSRAAPLREKNNDPQQTERTLRGEETLCTPPRVRSRLSCLENAAAVQSAGRAGRYIESVQTPGQTPRPTERVRRGPTCLVFKQERERERKPPFSLFFFFALAPFPPSSTSSLSSPTRHPLFTFAQLRHSKPVRTRTHIHTHTPHPDPTRHGERVRGRRPPLFCLFPPLAPLFSLYPT